MKRETLENINNDLFDSFNPEEELWIIGGATGSVTGSATYGPSGPDGRVDGDLDFALEE